MKQSLHALLLAAAGSAGFAQGALAHGDHGPVALTLDEMVHFLTSPEHLIGGVMIAAGIAIGIIAFRGEGRGKAHGLMRRLRKLTGRVR